MAAHTGDEIMSATINVAVFDVKDLFFKLEQNTIPVMGEIIKGHEVAGRPHTRRWIRRWRG